MKEIVIDCGVVERLEREINYDLAQYRLWSNRLDEADALEDSETYLIIAERYRSSYWSSVVTARSILGTLGIEWESTDPNDPLSNVKLIFK